MEDLENWFGPQETKQVEEHKETTVQVLPFYLPLEVWNEILKRLNDVEVQMLSSVNSCMFYRIFLLT